MTQHSQITPPLSGAPLARAVSEWVKLGAAVEIAPDGTIRIRPKNQDANDAFDMIDMKR